MACCRVHVKSPTTCIDLIHQQVRAKQHISSDAAIMSSIMRYGTCTTSQTTLEAHERLCLSANNQLQPHSPSARQEQNNMHLPAHFRVYKPKAFTCLTYAQRQPLTVEANLGITAWKEGWKQTQEPRQCASGALAEQGMGECANIQPRVLCAKISQPSLPYICTASCSLLYQAATVGILCSG